jgi:tryptophan synthase alpha chain
MGNKINRLFKSKQASVLSVFYTAGYPALEDTVTIAACLEAAGADIIEIGIPFSDPVADGPVIQESNTVALGNGMTVKKLLEQVREIRMTVKLPIVLMGYLNPVMQYGMEKFCKDAAQAGVDGIILPDMPMDEYQQDYRALFDANGLSNTFLISPTTSVERIRKVDEVTNGFIYAVSSSSTTGAKGEFSSYQDLYFTKLKELKLKNPFLIGFGVSDAATFKHVNKYSSGAIIGSAFISMLKQSGNFKKDITLFINGLKS